MISGIRPLPRRLLSLVAVALLPVALTASGALLWLNEQRRATLESTMVQGARAIAGAMDGELARIASVVRTLSASEALLAGDYERFYGIARRVLEVEPAWVTIALADPSGKYLFNLRRAYGDPLPAFLSELPTFEQLRATREPLVTGVFMGKVSGEALFSVRVPVVHEGDLRYVISAAVSPKAMLEVVERQQVPAQSIVAISDQNGAIVARSRRHEEFVARGITPDLRAAIARQGEGFAALMTLDGQRTYAAFSRSKWSGWAVAVGLPSEALDAPIRRSSAVLVAGGLLSVALGTLGALALARRIAHPIGAMAEAAAAIGRGERPRLPQSPIAELQAMSTALAEAAELRARAEEASRRKDEFLAMLGHELRNPLGVLSNAVNVLARRPAPDPATKALHDMLARQVDHLGRLIDDLLDASRVMAGKIALERAPLELAAELERVVGALREVGRLQAHAVTLHAEPVWVDADRHRLEQIVANLLDNALKYTPPGGRIDVRLRREGGEAVLEVQDEGIGIDPAMLESVFELFVQGGRTLERSQGGLGIGLTLVQRLTALHGGRVQAHSAGAGRGSRFTVRLPALAAPPRGERAAPPGAARERPAPRRVLVVEDGEDARASLRLLLEAAGHRVQEARTGPEGVRLALEGRPDVALIDIGLPGFDGYECARRIRADAAGRTLRLVALTGYGLDSDRAKALDAGFDAHVAKPVTPQALEALIA